MSTARHKPVVDPFDAVVIVGSQGALRSLRIILAGLPAGFPAAVIVDLHRAKGYGVVEQLLARDSALPLRLAAHGKALGRAEVHLAPEDRQLLVGDDGLISLSAPGDGIGHWSADPLLISAAHAMGPRLIAVVLSGRLDAGARGVCEVKRLGGRVMVQDPRSAEAPSMPNAALATGCVDFVLPPAGLGHASVAMCAAVGASDLFRVRLNAAVTG